jgi:subtilase family serine protease
LAVADAPRAQVEANEGNNTRSRTTQIGSDLVISRVTAPPSAAAGTAITAAAVVRNRGGGAANASTTRFHFSRDSRLTSADRVLCSGATPLLTAESKASVSCTATIPSGTPPGLHYLFVVADALNQVAEMKEGASNTTRVPITIPPR